MIDESFYDGYEGVNEVVVYYNQDSDKIGFKIWNGYFVNLLSGCYNIEIHTDGLLICYQNQDGFYEEQGWRIKNIDVVISELENYSDNHIESQSSVMLTMLWIWLYYW
ncbi:hypothetical protein [Anaerotignum propionicum]|uniref:hypothetical protein n=1 Tax=Anaerotignum propionicum TaxID=28446 RepID=UPI0028A2B8D4|nr:hypothetical protein [Anaerotignum propionicum]